MTKIFYRSDSTNTARRLAIAILLFALLPGIALATFAEDMANLGGNVENRPGEAGAIALFDRFGSNPWQGGSPWDSPMALPERPAGSTIPLPADEAEAADDVTAVEETTTTMSKLLETLVVGELAIADSCALNGSCDEPPLLLLPGGTYDIYAVVNGTELTGVWIELVKS